MRRNFVIILFALLLGSSCSEDLGCMNSISDPCFDWAYCNANMYEEGATVELYNWCIDRYNLPGKKIVEDSVVSSSSLYIDSTFSSSSVVMDSVVIDSIDMMDGTLVVNDSVDEDSVYIDSL